MATDINPQGLTAPQMSTVAGDVKAPSPADTIKASQATPGVTAQGGATGTTLASPAIPASPTSFQALTTTPIIPSSANPNVVSASDARAFTSSQKDTIGKQQQDLDQRQADLQKRSTALEGTIQGRAEAAFQRSKSEIESKLQPEKITAASAERNADLTAKAQEIARGTAGTPMGNYAMDELMQKHLRDQQVFNQREADLLKRAWDSALTGSIGEVAQAHKEIQQVQADRNKAIDEHNKQQKDALELDKMATDRADSTVQRMLKGDFTPNENQLRQLDQRYGLSEGSSATLYAAAKAEKAITDAKTADEAQTRAVTAAEHLSKYLDSQPTGTPIDIGGHTYIATGRGTLKTGVQIDKATGVGMAYEYDPATGRTTTTPMGTVGFADPGWKQEKDDQGRMWRVSASTNQMLPMTPGPAQKTNNSIMPEGVRGPALLGSEQYAGQCGAYNNFCYGQLVFGNTIEEKTAAIKQYPVVKNEDIQTNNTFLYKSGDTGHVGFVGDVVHDPNTGKITGFMADESNMQPPGKGQLSYSRFVSIDDPKIVGFADIPTPNKPRSGSDSSTTMAASGFEQPTFGLKTKEAREDKPLSADELTKRGLDPTDPKNANVTQADLAGRMNERAESGQTGALGTVPTGYIDPKVEGYDTKPISAAGGLTQSAIDKNAIKYILTNTMPPLGMGKGGGMRQSILNRAGQLADVAGVDMTTLQSEYKANSAALSKQVVLRASVAQFESTALKSMDLALNEMKGVGNDNVPLWQKYKQGLETGVFGDKKVAGFQTALKTFANEYAKIMSGSTSAAGATVSSMNDAEKLINSYMTKGMIDEVTDIMRQDMENKKTSIQETVNGISSTIGQFMKAAYAPSSTSETPVKSENSERPKQNPPAGRVWVKSSDGKIGTMPENMSLDPAKYTKL